MKCLLLTFDVEEFVIPREQNLNYNENEIFEIGKKGLIIVKDILDKTDIKSTFFITLEFAQRYPELIKRISNENHEIGFHGCKHSDDYSTMKSNEAIKVLNKGRKKLQKIVNKRIYGFRAPQLKKPKDVVLKEAGFTYDSSIHPTYIPGRCNYLNRSRHIVKKDGLILVPISVTPFFRLPFSWIWFRMLGINYAKMCTILSLIDTDYINLYFHPWEFCPYEKNLNIPPIYKWHNHRWLIQGLQNYINFCKNKKLKSTSIINYIKKEI